MNKESDLMRQRLSVLLDSLQATQVGASDAARTVELDQARVGRLSRMDALQAQAMSLESNRRREARIRNIRSALARIERGEYGDCIECGEPVDPRRLQADPAAALCIACAEVSGASG
jgi:DnaK suppressor protein